jgi:hypothetical protein
MQYEVEVVVFWVNVSCMYVENSGVGYSDMEPREFILKTYHGMAMACEPLWN